MKLRVSDASLTSSRPNQSDSEQTFPHGSASDSIDTRMGSTTLALVDGTDSDSGGATADTVRPELGRTTTVKPRLVSAAASNQHVKTTGVSGWRSLASIRVARVAGTTAVATMTAAMVSNNAWSGRTTASLDSQWKAWLQFFEDDGLVPLPVTEGNIVEFIGWLCMEREQGRRNVGSTSIPQYLTAVRQIHDMFTGTDVPAYLFVALVIRAYSRW